MYKYFNDLVNILEKGKVSELEVCSDFNNNYLPKDKYDMDNKLTYTLDENHFFLTYEEINLLYVDIDRVTNVTTTKNVTNENGVESIELEFQIFMGEISVYLLINYTI